MASRFSVAVETVGRKKSDKEDLSELGSLTLSSELATMEEPMACNFLTFPLMVSAADVREGNEEPLVLLTSSSISATCRTSK